MAPLNLGMSAASQPSSALPPKLVDYLRGSLLVVLPDAAAPSLMDALLEQLAALAADNENPSAWAHRAGLRVAQAIRVDGTLLAAIVSERATVADVLAAADKRSESSKRMFEVALRLELKTAPAHCRWRAARTQDCASALEFALRLELKTAPAHSKWRCGSNSRLRRRTVVGAAAPTQDCAGAL